VRPGEQKTNPFNIARFLVSHPRSAGVLVRKVLRRIRGRRGDQAANRAWLAQHTQDAAQLAHAFAPQLWEEAQAFGAELRDRAEPIIRAIPYDLGAGGDYEFLYWLTRLRKPETVIETGVSAGWTSQAFLAAMERNGRGTLYSSDFPFFRLPDPESVIGCVVEPRLKHRWRLFLDGDEVNLPKILRLVPSVDLLHYDSDKTYQGRAYAVNLIRPRLAPEGLIVMDDLSNNAWFKDEVTDQELPFAVFGEPARFGVIGEIGGSASSRLSFERGQPHGCQ
jgi:predicted O-methyltransferase YrrM